MQITDPFHEGEKQVQDRLGQREQAIRNGRAINTSIMKGALKFIAQQPMAVFGSVDADDHVWASVLLGEPGFITAADEHTVMFDLTTAPSHRDEPLWQNIERHGEVGLLLIEPQTRRRLRINGQIGRVAPDKLRLDVVEAFPNCPQYIQRRTIRLPGDAASTTQTAPAQSGEALAAPQRDWIAAADTFFVASVHPHRGADVSHRGGEPGFVRIVDDHTLRVPDYAGNSMFNTLGNFQVNPQAGVIFVDFDAARVLQMTGRSDIRWDLEEDAEHPTGGTRRYWDFTVDRWLEADLPYAINAELLDYWDKNPTAALAV